MIEEGQTILRRCLRRDQPGPYQLQAAINAVHTDAATIEETDSSQIVHLYDQLLVVAPTPVVALNRAIAIGEVDGPTAALAVVDRWTWTTTTHTTPPEPICSGGWADTARPRPPVSARPPWRRQQPNRTSSGAVVELRAHQTGDIERVASHVGQQHGRPFAGFRGRTCRRPVRHPAGKAGRYC